MSDDEPPRETDDPRREADDPPRETDDPAGAKSAVSDTTPDGFGTENPGGEFPAIAPDEVIGGAGSDGDGGDRSTESVNEPAKVLRIGSMVKTLLDEVRAAPLDEKSRVRLREIYEQSIQDLAEGLSPDLVAELKRMAPPFDVAAPSDAELRIAQAQLVGWLEGLFHGIQATLMSQQMAARAQLEEMRQRGLPSAGETGRTGAYL